MNHLRKTEITGVSIGRILQISIYSALAVNLLALIWAGLIYRPLKADGAFFFYSLVNNQWFAYDYHFMRHITGILQAPALLLLKILPGQDVSVSSKVHSLCMTLHPFLSLFYCRIILRQAEKTQFFPLVVLGFALGIFPMMAYSSMVVPETISVFWPLFLLLLLRKPGKQIGLLMPLILTIALAFGHETALLLFFFNIGILLARYKKSLKTDSGDIVLAAAQLISIIFLVWRILTAPAEPKQQFASALLTIYEENFDFYILHLGVFFTALLGLSLLKGLIPSAARKWSSIFMVVVSTSLLFLHLRMLATAEDQFLFAWAYIWPYRAIAIPISLFVAFGLAARALGLFKFRQAESGPDASISFLATIFLIACAGNDLTISKGWQHGYETTKELRERYPGCNAISLEAFKHLYGEGSYFYTFPYSLISFGPEESKKARAIFFPEENPDGRSCHERNQRFAAELPPGASDVFFRPGGYDFSQINSGPIRIIELKNGQIVSRLVPRQLSPQ